MSNKTLPMFSLSIIVVALLSACGGGDSTDNSSINTIPNNTPDNITKESVSISTDDTDTKTNTDKTTKDSDSTTTIPTTGGNGAFPLLSLNGSNPQYVSVGSSFQDQGATASDAVDGNLTSAITESNTVNTSVAGCYSQTYVVSDTSSNSDTITRTIFVGTDSERHSPNTAPITEELSITSTYNSKSNINLLSSAYDADCDTLSVTNVSQPLVGSVQLNSDGTVIFDPENNVGSHSFTYTISDSYGGSSTSGVTIASLNPNDGNDNWPVINNENVSTPKNMGILIDVLDNDYDDDGDALVLDMVDNPTNGTIQKQGGKVLYTPDVNFTGTDYFYYGVHDDHGHNGSGKTTITVY